MRGASCVPARRLLHARTAALQQTLEPMGDGKAGKAKSKSKSGGRKKTPA
jgi:hypothetical protein